MVKSIQRKWNHWLRGQMTEWLRREMACYPMRETLPEDIFLISYPKSGNTWFRYLCMSAVYGVSPEHLPESVIEELSPDAHRHAFYHRFATPMFIKSHNLPRSEYRRVVYLVRDGRDALVSYLHYSQHYETPVADYVAAARFGTGLGAGQWHEHVEQWLANPHGADLLIIRYEDLLRDPVAELERFCAFAGITRPRENLEKAARETSFENLRKWELAHNPGKAGKPRDSLFFRRGVAGSYRDELPEACLHAFEESSWPTLQRLGYVVAGHTAQPHATQQSAGSVNPTRVVA